MSRRTVPWLALTALLVLSCAPSATPTAAPQATTGLPTATSAPRATAAPGATPTPKPSASPTAAATGPKRGGTVRSPQREEPVSWDPSRSHVDPATTTKYLVFSKLFTTWSDNPQNCQSQAYPWAVQTWKWVDDTTAEFTLKQGIRFQNRPPVNGREAVAQDVVLAFDRYKKNLSYMAGKSALIDSVTATDKYTFRIKTRSPWGSMVTELLVHFYGPWLEATESGGPNGELWEQPAKSWTGSGAFLFDSWQPGVKWRMVRNPDYWVQGRPYLDAVEMVVIPDASTQLAALRSGQLNLIREFNEDMLDVAVRERPSLQVARCPGTTMSGASIVWMNNSGPPFNDARVRRAVVMSIDQETLIKNLYRGRAVPGMTLPSVVQYAMKLDEYSADVRPFLQYNPTQAKQLLTEAGFANGLDTVINFSPRYAAPAAMVAEAVAGMLGAVGIRAKLNMMEYGRYSTTVLQAKYPVGELAITPRTVNTPEDNHGLFAFSSGAGATNRSVVNDPEYDKLYDTFRATTDDKKRQEQARQLQTMVAGRAYAAWLPLTDSSLTVAPGIHFVWIGNTRDYSLLLETAWFD